MSDAAVETLCQTVLFIFVMMLFYGNPFSRDE
jgi:hypothetical protein